jgi:hypothetical protein
VIWRAYKRTPVSTPHGVSWQTSLLLIPEQQHMTSGYVAPEKALIQVGVISNHVQKNMSVAAQ